MSHEYHQITPEWAVTQEMITAVVDRIVATVQPSRVILFGSRARAHARPDSDVDLLVIKEQVTDAASEAARLRRVLRGLLPAMDIVVVSKEKFEYWKDVPGNVYYEASLDGRALYEAA